MNERIDVLAVMCLGLKAISRLPQTDTFIFPGQMEQVTLSEAFDRMNDARAAVAELIEAAKLPSMNSLGLSADGTYSLNVSFSDWERFLAALARVAGGQ